jgi:hypothetical protein
MAITMDSTSRLKGWVYAMKIVSPDEHDDFMVVGWKVSKKLPK